MGFYRNSRFFGLFVLVLFSAGQVLAAAKYVVVLKSQASYRTAKDVSQRSGGFLGTRAVAQDYLDNLEMAIVESDESQIEQIKNNPLVAFVEKEYVIPMPRFKLAPKSNVRHIPHQNAQLTWGVQAVKADKAWATTKGAGTRVMVLDSGIDERHIDLAGTIEAMRAFTGSTMKDDIGHGTHTAGTVLADGKGSGLLGVAPEAKLLVGKVCSGMGCNSTAILQGVEWAITENVDVVNMSLGGPFLASAAAAAYKKAEAAGVMVVAASGNNGNGSVSFPAALDSVLAVGALMPDLTKASFSQWGPSLDVMAPGVNVYSTVPAGMGRASFVRVDVGNGFEVVDSNMVFNGDATVKLINSPFMFSGLGSVADFQGKDLSGSVALIQRGEITFTEKVNNAIAAGAKAVVIFNNVPGLLDVGIEKAVKVPVVFIDQMSGERIVQALTQNSPVATEVGTVATDYMMMHGTSMASPHTAGVAALVRAVNKSLTPAQVRDLIKATATPLLPNPSNQMGQGLVDAEKAVEAARALVLPPQAAVGF